MFDYDYNCYEDNNEVKEKIHFFVNTYFSTFEFCISKHNQNFKSFKNLIKLFSAQNVEGT